MSRRYGSPSGAGEFDNHENPDEFLGVEHYTISLKKPYFSLVLSKQHMSERKLMTLPQNMQSILPKKRVPTVLQCYGKKWKMWYTGNCLAKRFDAQHWAKFVDGNNLKIGDCCTFELLECSNDKILFKVILVKSTPPPSLDGSTAETPIVID